MTSNQKKIIRLLTKYEYMTAAALARELNVTDRSIRNYIVQICSDYPNAISSGNNGYHLEKPELFTQKFEYIQKEIPQTQEERTVFLINLLINTDENHSLNIFDVADEIFVSTSTIRNDLKKIRALLSEHALQLVLHGDSFYLYGTEKNRRRLIGSLVQQESRTGFTNLSFLQQYYPDIDVFFIKDTVISVFNRYEYFINDYFMNNLITHILIAIDRIKKGNICNSYTQGYSQSEFKEYTLAREISDILSEHFQLTYTGDEIYDLAFLISSRATAFDYQKINYSDIQRFVGPKCYSLVDTLINEIDLHYGINLAEPEFFVRFSLHIHNLLIRAENHSFTKNPLVNDIKKSYPLIFDISVIAASIIYQKTGIKINDDEIAYIAFHLGNAIELQEKYSTKINTVLFCPRYYDFGVKLAKKVESSFRGQLLITNIITNEEDLSKVSQIDLVLSTINILERKYLDTKIITINMLSLTEQNISAIRDFIEKFNKQKVRTNFCNLLKKITCDDLFDVSSNFDTKNECLDYMCDVLLKKGYVNSSYRQEIAERESLSSTAFGDFAIPHSMKMSASKTGIYVVIPKSPIPWDSHEVSIILMMCFNQNDRNYFNEAFDNIASIFVEPKKLEKIIQCKDYNAFIYLLSQLL